MLVTLLPTPPLIRVVALVPVPVPLLVIVPALFTLAVESVIPLVIALLLLSTKLPVPVTPPDRVSSELPLALLLVKVVMLLPPCMVSAPLTFKAEVVLFSVMPVTALPTPALTNVAPVPVPLLVIIPALFTLVVDSVRLLFVLVLLFSTKLPVPVTPPVTVKVPAVSVRVVPPLATVIAVVVMLSGEVPFSIMLVTVAPTPPLIKVMPEPLPLLVIVPVLPTLAVDRVKLLSVLVLLFSTKLPVPDTPPVTVKLPAVSVRVVPPLATVIAVVVMLSGE